jgi:hypothetical protein
MTGQCRDENVLPRLSQDIALVGDEMPVLSSICDELAARRHHDSVWRVRNFLPAQALLG